MTAIRDRIIQAGRDTWPSKDGEDFLAAACEALRLAKERLLSNTERLPPPGMLTPMQVAANQIDTLLTEIETGSPDSEVKRT